MHDEAGFLSAIRQTPADDVTRLVFADWLDEQDDSGCKLKAEFIRLELRMAETPEKSLNRVRWLRQLQKRAAQINPSWLAVVSYPKLEACRVAFQFECPQRWEKLTPTNNPTVRFCAACKQSVHHCATLEEARSYAQRGNCVVLSLALVRKPNDLFPPSEPSIPLTPHQLDQLRIIGRLSPSAIVSAPMYELPAPPPVPSWAPEPSPRERDDRRPKPRHRKKRRPNHRNIQRENWEEME